MGTMKKQIENLDPKKILTFGRFTPSDDLQRKVRALVASRGLDNAIGALGMSRETVLRVASGSPVRAGTVLLTEQRLRELDV